MIHTTCLPQLSGNVYDWDKPWLSSSLSLPPKVFCYPKLVVLLIQKHRSNSRKSLENMLCCCFIHIVESDHHQDNAGLTSHEISESDFSLSKICVSGKVKMVHVSRALFHNVSVSYSTLKYQKFWCNKVPEISLFAMYKVKYVCACLFQTSEMYFNLDALIPELLVIRSGYGYVIAGGCFGLFHSHIWHWQLVVRWLRLF